MLFLYEQLECLSSGSNGLSDKMYFYILIVECVCWAI